MGRVPSSAAVGQHFLRADPVKSRVTVSTIATVAGNLALACFSCNNAKGPNIAGIDPVSKAIVRLFHPRLHKWSAHFRWDGPALNGRTPIGRTTIEVLEINLPRRLVLRRMLIEEGVFPP